MEVNEQYQKIFDKEILQCSKGVIFTFSPLYDRYLFQPYCHSISSDGVESLAKLMRHNLLFYCYGEDEVVNYYKEGSFSSLDQSARYAYRNRLPQRAEITDGLPGEVLLDLLVQLYNPAAFKLAVRTIFRQNDNNEIKGYDLTYFSRGDSGISIWLGQAKLGEETYCKTEIVKDLMHKFSKEYLSNQIFFVCDKRVSLTDDAKSILKAIEEINILSMTDSPLIRAKQLIDFFKKSAITIKIPCLLAYGKDSVYKNANQLYDKIIAETDSIKKYIQKHTFVFDGFSPEIVFYIFPIESIERLRDKDNGFYSGLC